MASDEHDSDAKLVEQALAGSDEALDTLIRRHLPSVRKLLRRMCGDEETAEDLVQETCIKASRLKALRSYDPARPFQAWILKIAKNTGLDYMRSPERRREVRWAEDIDFEAKGALQDRELAETEMWQRCREYWLDWVDHYMPSERQANARRAIAMSLDGFLKNWPAIASVCGYLNEESARISVYRQVKEALESSEALEAARAIHTHLGIPSSVYFLGIIPLKGKK